MEELKKASANDFLTVTNTANGTGLKDKFMASRAVANYENARFREIHKGLLTQLA